MSDPLARILQGSKPTPAADPLAGVLGSQQQADPLASLLGTGSSRAPEPVPTNRLLDAPRRFGEVVSQIAHHPVDAALGMAKVVLLDALKIQVPGLPNKQPEWVTNMLPELKDYKPTLSSVGGAALRTGANIAFPEISRAIGPVAAAAGVGALQSPNDPVVGAMLGGSLGVIGKTAGELGRRAGLRNAAKSGAPVPESKVPDAPEPPPAPPTSAIRDLTNSQILDMTPTGIEIVAKQAAKEEKALYTELFGPKGARQYRALTKTSTSADASPEAAARALAKLQSMRNELTPGQQTALDDINSRGFTSKRLKRIAELTKDYTPENLAGVADPDELARMFGDVLMTKKPDRNLAGLYRLRSVYNEIQSRGISDEELLRGVYEYMLGQGIKPQGLGKMIVEKMMDVRGTLSKIKPETVAPMDEGLRSQLGPITEQQFQQELADITPKPAPVVDEAAARVEAARTTPLPGTTAGPETVTASAVKTQSGRVYQAPLHIEALRKAAEAGEIPRETFYKALNGLEQPPVEDGFITSTGRFVTREEAAKIAGFEGELDAGDIGLQSQADPLGPGLRQPVMETPISGTPSPSAVDAVRKFAKDESGYLNLDALTDPLQTKIDPKTLPPHSKAIQEQIEVGYKPDQPNPMKPIEGLYTALVRRTHPFEKGEAAVARATGKPVPVRERPSAAIQLLAGWAGKAQHFLEYGGFREINGQIVPTGNKGLEQIFQEAGDLNAFRRQAIAQRVVELDDAGRKVETGINPADARIEVARGSIQAKSAVADLHTYLDGVLQYGTDAGLLDPATAQFLRTLGQAYVPLERVLKKGTKNLGNVQYSALSTPQQFRNLVGSKLRIVDPLYSTVDYTRRIIRASELNRVGQTIVDFVEAHPNETKGWLERMDNAGISSSNTIKASGQGIQQIAKQLGINIDLNTAKQIGSILGDSNLLVEGDIMRVRKGGEIVQYRVDPVLGQVLRSIGPQQLDLWIRLLGAPTQALKVGVTANPFFGAMQAFVGAFQTKIQSQYGFRITQDPAIGLYNRVKATPKYQEALAAGGTSAFLSATARSTEASLRSITGGNAAARAIRSVAHPLEALRAIADPLEEMNRLGEYIRARGKGADVMEAALAMREADTDFSMIGTQMAGFSHLIAFANPFLQAGDKAIRTLSKSPTAWLAGAVGVTVPSIAFWLAADGDKQVRDLQRSKAGTRYWFARLPKTGEIIKVPKPYLYGEVFGSTAEAVMNQMETDSPEQYGTLAKGIRDNFSFLFLPTIAQTITGALANKDPLNNWSDIVPESRAGLEPMLQYTDQSTEAARAIGEALNVSPAKIDFAIRSLGGTLAQEGMKSLDHLIPNGPASPPAPVSADLPLIGRFFARYPSESVEPIRTFYQNAGDALVKLNTAKKLIDQMKPDQARDYVIKNKDILALADGYGKIRQEFAEKRGLMEKIRDVPDNVMTPQTKRELTDQILTAMIESARQVNDAVRQQKRNQTQIKEASGGTR